MTIVAVCGMESERLQIGLRPGLVTVVGSGNAALLEYRLNSAIESGGVSHIISIGLAGALDTNLRVGDVVIGVTFQGNGSILHCEPPEWTQRLYAMLTSTIAPPPFRVSFAGFAWSETVVATAAEKAALRAATSADVVDQETWIAATIARKHGLPFQALRVVSDTAAQGLPPAALVPLTASGGVSDGAVLASIGSDPEQIPELGELETDTTVAFNNLGLALSMIGDSFLAYID